MIEKLSLQELKATPSEHIFAFETTAEVPPLEGIIGQDRAANALAFGLRMTDEGYNIYLMGITGTGRNSYTKAIVAERAKEQLTPSDWCYVYDFEHPDSPLAIAFTPGSGALFKEGVETFIARIREDVPKAFESDEFRNMRSEAVQQFQSQSVAVLEKLSALAKSQELLFKPTGKGYVTVPTLDGQPLNEQRLQELDAATLERINQRIQSYQKNAEPLFEELGALEREVQEKLQALERKAGASIVSPLLDAIRKKFEVNEAAQNYLTQLEQDIYKHLRHFYSDDGQPEEDKAVAAMRAQGKEGWEIKYKVNLFVDNGHIQGAPVVFETNSSYYNLFGMIEFQPSMGTLITNLTKVKAGSLHRANGGYLILQAEDLFSNAHSWKALKRAVKNRQARVENIPDGSSGVITGLKPQAIPLDVKVILIGSYEIYMLLYRHDEDFRKLFKIKVDFETEMARQDENIMKMAAFISRHCRDRGLRNFHRGAVAAVIDYSSRLADNQNKLSTRFNDIVELLAEANSWAALEKATLVEERHITKALYEKRYRADKYEQKVHELFADGTYLMDVQGLAVGQINGLAVLNMGDYSFGKPARITVNTFTGKKGVINIEKEAQLSGRIHNKGVLIIGGYLGAKFAQRFPLTLTATLCFEQSYDGVDGDSASSTELYALLSSLADVPIKQGIAVTGSVNQKGEIQPIGGVNEKIEGFYRLCSKQGLTGEQGVLIPAQNKRQLMLHSEVLEAVKAGRFHIYAVRTIEEGIEVLTGMPAGERDSTGEYTEGSIFRLVEQKLAQFYQQALKEE
ncbi:MAG: Lon protease [Firmicutes bacterium]|nr:Lon protease [candidate division NPL-UPA2 bacterium]